MSEKRDIITKGMYKHAQTLGFVSAKQYIFFNKNNKRCLSLRFSNDMDVAIDGINFTIAELDANGKLIRNSKAHFSGTVLPGRMFAPDDAVVVDPKCCDFKVTVDKVVSRNYEYTSIDGKVFVRYCGRLEASTPDPLVFSTYDKMSKKKSIHTWLFKLAAVVLLLVLIAANLVFGLIVEPEEDEKMSRNAKISAEELSTETTYYLWS